MGSSKRGRKQKGKQQQQQLAFVPLAAAQATAAASSRNAASPPEKAPSPAQVRFSSPSGTKRGSPGSRGESRMLVKPVEMARPKKSKKQQQTLEASLGKYITSSHLSMPPYPPCSMKRNWTRIQTSRAQFNVDPQFHTGGKKTTRSKKRSVTKEEDDSGPLPLTIGDQVKVRRRVAASPPPSSFMPRTRNGSSRGRVVVDSDSDCASAVEGDDGVGDSDSDGDGPLKQETPQRRTAGRPRKIVTISGDSDSSDEGKDKEETRGNIASSQSLPNQAADGDDSDDQPLVTPRSSMPRRRALKPITLHDSDDDEEDDIQSPAKRRRLGLRRAAPVSPVHDSDESTSTEDDLTGQAILGNKTSFPPPASKSRSIRSETPKRKHRTEKEKRMELLRRRRAGEKNLTMEDLESSEDDAQGALYDTDPELEVLEVFDDESETEQKEEPTTKKEKKRNKAKKSKAEKPPPEPRDEDANTEDEDFIDDEDDTIGVPDEALAQIPLEFTRASRKPLKAHFKDAIEWLVHRKINPAFERDNEVYGNAWRRLSDEVTGLANSKFVSSVWKPEFYKALRARPYIVQQELGAGFALHFENCQACGRSGHPATWSISFHGKPYNSKTLDEVESESEDSDDQEGGGGGDRGKSLPTSSYTNTSK